MIQTVFLDTCWGHLVVLLNWIPVLCMFKFEQLSFGLSYHLPQEILNQPMVSSMTKHIFLPTQTYPYRLEAKSTLPVVTFKRLKTTTTSCSTGINLKYRNPLSHLFLPTKKRLLYYLKSCRNSVNCYISAV